MKRKKERFKAAESSPVQSTRVSVSSCKRIFASQTFCFPLFPVNWHRRGEKVSVGESGMCSILHEQEREREEEEKARSISEEEEEEDARQRAIDRANRLMMQLCLRTTSPCQEPFLSFLLRIPFAFSHPSTDSFCYSLLLYPYFIFCLFIFTTARLPPTCTRPVCTSHPHYSGREDSSS